METPEERTKRVFLQYLNGYAWVFQCSFFYNDLETSDAAILNGAKLRKFITRDNPEATYLWRLCRKGRVVYWTVFSTVIIDKEVLDKARRFGFDGLSKRKVNQDKIDSYALAVKKQRPHSFEDLKNIFGFEKINRIAIVGRDTK